MSIQPGPAPKIPELTLAELSEARLAFRQQLRMELLIRGEQPDAINSMVRELADRIEVVSRTGGPETRMRLPNGGTGNVVAAADCVQELLRERERFVAAGPDPEPLLRDRLKLLGLNDVEAQQAAAGAIRRLPDGRVVGVAADGSYYGGEPEVSERQPNGEPWTDEQLAVFRSPDRALEAVTRRIVTARAKQGDQERVERIKHRLDAAGAYSALTSGGPAPAPDDILKRKAATGDYLL